MPESDLSISKRFTGRQLRELLELGNFDARTTWDLVLEIDRDRLVYLLTEMCADTGQSAEALLDAVCSPDTLVDVLAAVKSTAKRLSSVVESPAQKAAATLLYHLSVASALGHHSRNISSKDMAERLPLYRDLAAQLADDDLASIFEKALSRVASGGH